MLPLRNNDYVHWHVLTVHGMWPEQSAINKAIEHNHCSLWSEQKIMNHDKNSMDNNSRMDNNCKLHIHSFFLAITVQIVVKHCQTALFSFIICFMMVNDIEKKTTYYGCFIYFSSLLNFSKTKLSNQQYWRSSLTQ